MGGIPSPIQREVSSTMMKEEFENLAGYEVSYDDYHDIIEPMYMVTNLSKSEFVKVINKKTFALPTKQTIVKEMREIASYISDHKHEGAVWHKEVELDEIAKNYAERFYHIDLSHDMKAYVYFNRDDVMNIVPNEIVIGRGTFEFERIKLI